MHLKRRADHSGEPFFKDLKRTKTSQCPWRDALINVFGVPDPSKTAFTKAKLESLKQLCSDFHLAVGISGRRPIKQDYIAAILNHSEMISDPGVVRMEVDEMQDARGMGGATRGQIEVRLFDHAGDFATTFRRKLFISTQSDGSLCLTRLADTLAVSQPAVVDPRNFHPLHTPDRTLHPHHIKEHIRSQGFIRVICVLPPASIQRTPMGTCSNWPDIHHGTACGDIGDGTQRDLPSNMSPIV